MKGKQVYVEGRLQTRSYDDKDGKKVWTTDVIAEDVILLGGRGGGAPRIPASITRRGRSPCRAAPVPNRPRRPRRSMTTSARASPKTTSRSDRSS